MANIHIAHARAAKDMGAGKDGGLKSVCQQAACNELPRAPPWRKNHLYKGCFQGFIDNESEQTLSMKGGKVMTKGPPREGSTRPTFSVGPSQPTVIGALFFHHRDHPVKYFLGGWGVDDTRGGGLCIVHSLLSSSAFLFQTASFVMFGGSALLRLSLLTISGFRTGNLLLAFRSKAGGILARIRAFPFTSGFLSLGF
jgi:hypothetical protein